MMEKRWEMKSEEKGTDVDGRIDERFDLERRREYMKGMWNGGWDSI